MTYCLVSLNFRAIWDISVNVLLPNDWMVDLRLEELCNVFCLRFEGVESFLTEDIGEMSLNSNNCSTSNMVVENPKRCDHLQLCWHVTEWWIAAHLLDDGLCYCFGFDEGMQSR